LCFEFIPSIINQLKEFAAKEKLEIASGVAPLKTAKEPVEKHRFEPYFNFWGRKFFNHKVENY